MALDPQDRTEEIVHSTKLPIPFKQSTGQARKKTRGECRLVVQYHFDIPDEDLKALSAAHGRQYYDAVEFGRALVKWLQAEGKAPNVAIAEEASRSIGFEVAK